MSYMDKIHAMNALGLNTSAYAALIAELQKVQSEALAALQLKQKLLDQAVTQGVQKGLNLGISYVEDKTSLPQALQGTTWGKKYTEVQQKTVGALREATTVEGLKKLAEAGKEKIVQVTADIAEAKKVADQKLDEMKKQDETKSKAGSKSGGGGGGGKSSKEKDTEDTKRLEKATKQLEDQEKNLTKAIDNSRKAAEKAKDSQKKWNDLVKK